MCDINCIWLFNLLVAFVLIIQQQQHVVVCSIQQQQQQEQEHHQQQHLHSPRPTSTSLSSPYDDITSYASALATKYLHQHSLPKVNVVKREIKNDKNTDFISYLSDFNMQDETSIPEDIFDQRHLREIEEKERKVGKKTLGVATDVADGDDVIDVNLPYDDAEADADVDADAEADADIILESQRSIERNFSNDDDSNYNKNKSYNRDVDRNEGEVGVGVGVRAGTGTGTDGIGDTAEVRPKDNSEGLTTENLKKPNNNKKKMLLKEKKKLNFVRSNDKKRQQGKEIKYENYIGSTSTQQRQYTYDQQLQQQDKIDDDNYYDGIIDDEEDDDDGSAEYERFKLMHEQKQREQQLQKERATLKQELEKKRQQQQQQQQEKLRQQHQEELDNVQQQQKYHMSSWKKLNEGKFNKASLNDNEETMMANKDNSADQDDNNAGNNKNNDEADDFETPQQQQEGKTQQREQQQQDAIGDIDDEQQSKENDSILKESKNPVENKDYTNVFIPRKMKRHNGAARLDDATNRYTRIKKQHHQQQQQEQHPHHQYQQSKSQNSNENDDDSYAVDNQDEYMPHFGTQQGESFKKSYYGIVKGNSTQINDSNQLKDNSADKKDNDEHHVNADGKDIATIRTRPTLHQGGLTLFEKEKSLRRINKHYGHKTHKKKYKDYIRYSSLMMIRAPTTALAETAEASTTTAAPFLVVTSTPTTTTRVVKLDHPNSEDILRYHKDNYEKKLKMDRIKGIALPSSPIFVLKPKTMESQEKFDPHYSDPKPFYEGQINYYLETDDDDDDSLGGRGGEARFITKGERMDTNDWYRKLSPVLRNGVKTGNSNSDKDERVALTGITNAGGVGATGAGSANGAVVVSGGYTPYHHYRNHYQRSQHHHHNNHHHNQKHQHHQHSRHHAYQRKMLPKKVMATTTPLPPPSRRHETNSPIQELAHQITDVKEFERYYAKWPHLARVQSQLHDEQLREQLELQNLHQQQLGNYQDYEYDEDYFEALQSGNVEENVPPYIRKYNRRNKQLLDLLEGTLPPPTRPPQQLRWSGSKLQPGPRDSSVGSISVRIDDDYLKEKRKRYHQRQKQIHDLFEQQRTITTTMVPTTNPNENINEKMESNNRYENHFPDEDISISLETQEHDENEPHNWQTAQGSKSPASSSIPGRSQILWQREKLITSSSTPPTGFTADAVTVSVPTLKPAIYKLPSYPSIAGSFMQRPRSRSAQFAPSSGTDYRRGTPLQFNSGTNNFINAGGFVAFNGAMAKNTAQQQNNGKSISARFSANDEENNKGSTAKPEIINTSRNNNNNQQDSSGSISSSSSQTSLYSSPSSSSPASVSNSFVYHRVIDASPRFVGAGLTGRKQRLPFVAITDRRLETSKKSLTDHQKDFEQNHYPMP